MSPPSRLICLNYFLVILCSAKVLAAAPRSTTRFVSFGCVALREEVVDYITLFYARPFLPLAELARDQPSKTFLDIVEQSRENLINH